MAKYQIKSITATFGSTSYKVVQAPGAQPQSSDPTDVTCLDDTSKQFIKGAIANNDTFDLVVNGINEAPTINTVADLTLSVIYCDGSTDTTKSVAVGKCILTNVQPPNPEAGGDRAANYTLTFQPGAVAPSGGGNT